MRSYDELVDEGREAVQQEQDAKWRLGDLAKEVVPANEDGIHDGGRLDQYAEDIGITAANLRQYRMVAVAWPADTRVSASWTAHRELAAHPDRHSLLTPGMTVNDARRLAGYKPQGNERPRTTQEKVEAVRDLMADEDVATAAASDAHVRAAFSRASEYADEERRERSRATDPLGGTRDKLEVEKSIATLNKMARHLVEQVGSVDEPQSGWLDRIDAIIELLEMAKDVASGGGFDKAMADLLSGGDAA